MLQHEVFGPLGHCEHGVNLGTEEAWREDVRLGTVVGGIAELELFVGELAVDVEDAVLPGYFVGHLDGKDGFAQVGVGEKAADFSFIPE